MIMTHLPSPDLRQDHPELGLTLDDHFLFFVELSALLPLPEIGRQQRDGVVASWGWW